MSKTKEKKKRSKEGNKLSLSFEMRQIIEPRVSHNRSYKEPPPLDMEVADWNFDPTS